jgi:hypothetical protein
MAQKRIRGTGLSPRASIAYAISAKLFVVLVQTQSDGQEREKPLTENILKLRQK